MANVNVLGARIDCCLLAQKHRSIVVVEDSRRYCVDRRGRHLLHGEDVQESTEPEKVFGAISHGHVFGLSRRQSDTTLSTTSPAYSGPAKRDGVAGC